MRRRIAQLTIAGLLLGLWACEPSEPLDDMSPLADSGDRRFPERAFEISDDIVEVWPKRNPDRNAYFGDLHVHTTYSFDAFSFGTTATPNDAYRYAMGEPLEHPAGFEMKLREPLDFYAVTDHALFLGLAAEAADTSTEFSKLEVSQPLHDLNAPDNKGLLSLAPRLRTFGTFAPTVLTGLLDGNIDQAEATRITRTAWLDIIDAAERFNDPGRFTTFVAYEYTSSSDDRGNLHRNVIFKDSDRLPAEPFSRFHSQNPEGLWDWMDGLREQGIESLAIPHNSNGSNGQMFKLVDWAGNPMDDDYALQRLRNEPLVEITQVKGTSETHPGLSDTDEWANFEIMPYRVATFLPSEPAGSYARDALRRGLGFEEAGIVNPYKFGFIGSSDTHTGATSDDESNFFSKLGLLDATPALRGSTPLPLWQSLFMRFMTPDQVGEVGGETYTRSPSPTFGAAGLAAVWAEANTRAAIYEAFRRKETFATSGPRIRLRFFAGYDFDASLLEDSDVISEAYGRGVSMGSDLDTSGGSAPSFLAWAIRDPLSAPLQRLQIVKGWSEGGETFEKVYDVACSDGGRPDPKTSRCPDNGARVNLGDCSYSTDSGSPELKALWSDPGFDPEQRAFYYVRVLENPTCRWSTWDAIRSGVEARPDLQTTIQERAWSSPIWLIPAVRAASAE
ncbi:MAG: DUF3604 domain-containing protein [Myxococcota bacterium]